MKKLIIIIAEITGILAFAANIEKPKSAVASNAVVTVSVASARPATARRDGTGGMAAHAQKKVRSGKRYEALKARAEKVGMSVEEFEAEQNKRDAARYGVDPDKWNAMTRKERSAVRQRALAAKKGMTVEQMKDEADRKAAAKCGCPLEKWKAMSVKERIEYRKQAQKR